MNPGVFTPNALFSFYSFLVSLKPKALIVYLLLLCLYHSNLYPGLVPIPNCELLKGRTNDFIIFESQPNSLHIVTVD